MTSPRFFMRLLIGAALAVLFTATAQASILVNVDKTHQTATISVDGSTLYVWPVSTGRLGFDTPNGTFKVNRLDPDHVSDEYPGARMTRAMFFDLNGHAVHGFFDVKHLGSPVSHGCVRLAPDNAAILFALVQGEGLGQATVVVSGQTPARDGEVRARQLPPPGYQTASPQTYPAPPPGYYAPPTPPGYYNQQAQPYYAPQQGYFPPQARW
jgi:hypothetical protein